MYFRSSGTSAGCFGSSSSLSEESDDEEDAEEDEEDDDDLGALTPAAAAVAACFGVLIHSKMCSKSLSSSSPMLEAIFAFFLVGFLF
jgi:hypothetical protein